MENPEKVILTCRHCGHTGEDVNYSAGWVGGRGLVIWPYCIDRNACWQRWHKNQENIKQATGKPVA